MEIINVTLHAPRKSNLEFNASVTLQFENGSLITIHDLRVIKNKMGQLWVALPNYSVTSGGKSWEYFPTVELDAATLRTISDAVLLKVEEAGVRQ